MTEVIQALSAEAMIALLLIFALIVAFIVAARRRRAGGYKMNARLVRDESPVPDPHDRTARELPNGGARTVGRQDPTFGEYLTDAEPRDFERAQRAVCPSCALRPCAKQKVLGLQRTSYFLCAWVEVVSHHLSSNCRTRLKGQD